MLEILGSVDALKTYLLSFGVWTPAVFFLIQVAQVVFSPIPGAATTFIGGTLFGAFPGFVLSASAILLGSCLAYLLANKLGRPFVLRFSDAKWIGKMENMAEEKLNIALFLIFLFPGFPDDLLCLVSGLTKMPFKTFLSLCILGRFPGLLVTSLIGAGLLSNDPKTSAMLLGSYCLVSLILYLLRHKVENYISRHRKKSPAADGLSPASGVHNKHIQSEERDNSHENHS